MTLLLDDGRTIGFGSNLMADLSDILQPMAFVLKAKRHAWRTRKKGRRWRPFQCSG
ncbi:hypothetical protein [Pseudomonas fluorescens]|uniref:Uncharacterized protein n=1 Tax=Pseudomonas fluorescens TaxID=294 RepID=A0A5E7DSY9_PSEFL|nr:hypothetical protein [Pseudomonas fluorescens]VVO14985.1 hypothetical protein PS691_03720 [Pseudomonas fluorescens]